MAFDCKFDLRLFESRSLIEESFTGLLERDFRILEGSRLVLSVRVVSVTGTLNIGVGNDFEADGSFDNLDAFPAITTPGNYKLILTDFHSLFKLKFNVGAGNVVLHYGITSDDNSHNEVTIENAEIEVNLDAANDSVTAIIKDEDGDALEINPDGSINANFTLPPGLATETTLQAVLAAVDQLEGYTDGIEALIAAGNALLTSINTNTDQLEGYVDGLEGLVAATNALLTTIRDNADNVETLLTSIDGHVDGLEALATTANGLLTQIRDNADTVETLLAAIGNNTDGIETLLGTTNTQLTAINANTDGLEALVTSSNALLTQIRDNADTVETVLGNILTEIASAHYTMNAAFSKATAIAGQLDDTATTVATEDNVAPVRITAQRALHTNLRNVSGTEVATATNPLRIDPTGTTSQPVVGPGANGAAIVGNPVRISGSDGVNTRDMLTDAAGRLVISGAGGINAPLAGVVSIQGTETATPILSQNAVVVRPLPYTPVTIYVSALAVAMGSGKSMFSVLNASGSVVKLRLRQLFIYNVQTTAVTGVVADFQLRFIANHSAGTQITVTPAAAGRARLADTSDALNASVTFRTGATLTSEDGFALRRWLWSSDEWGPGTADAETQEHTSGQLMAAYDVKESTKPITLNAGEGFTIRQNTASTAGSFDIFAVFTQEA